MARNDEGPALATPTPQEQTQQDAAIVTQPDADRKLLATLQATAAQSGCGLYELAGGAFLLTKYGLSRELPDLGAVATLLRQMGARP